MTETIIVEGVTTRRADQPDASPLDTISKAIAIHTYTKNWLPRFQASTCNQLAYLVFRERNGLDS